MTEEQKAALQAILEAGHLRHWLVIEARLHEFIEQVAAQAYERGFAAGQSPHDGTWPSDTPRN